MKTRLLLLAIFVAVLLLSCKEFNIEDDPSPQIVCEWNEEKTISFNDLQLRIPTSGISYFFKNQFPEYDGIIRQLTTVMNTRGDHDPSGSSKANIKTNLKIEGDGCTGEKTVTYYKGNSKISGNTLTVPFISNDVFAGEVTIKLRSDAFNEFNASYQVLWTTTGNNPDNVTGNILGSKITYSIDNQSIIIPIRQPIFIDGQELLEYKL